MIQNNNCALFSRTWGQYLKAFTGLAFGAVALVCTPLDAQAQAYPNRAIKLIVTFPTGGAPDILARMIAEKTQLGQTIVVDNKPGAGGNIGADLTAKAPADG